MPKNIPNWRNMQKGYVGSNYREEWENKNSKRRLLIFSQNGTYYVDVEGVMKVPAFKTMTQAKRFAYKSMRKNPKGKAVLSNYR